MCISGCFRLLMSVIEIALFVCLCLFRSCILLGWIAGCFIADRLLFGFGIVRMEAAGNVLLISRFANGIALLLLLWLELRFLVSILISLLECS